MSAARKQAVDELGELAARSAITARVHASYGEFRARSAPWSRFSIEAVLRVTRVSVETMKIVEAMRAEKH